MDRFLLALLIAMVAPAAQAFDTENAGKCVAAAIAAGEHEPDLERKGNAVIAAARQNGVEELVVENARQHLEDLPEGDNAQSAWLLEMMRACESI
jgi:hypothetical protein